MPPAYSMMHTCFAPIADGHSRILILGSLPGPQSLASGEYYKNPSNHFWRLIYALHGHTPAQGYSDKCAFLLKNKLALWDVFCTARREGASDSAIHDETPNDFVSFLAEHTKISGIVFNGGKAALGFKKAAPELLVRLPHETVWSTSGACARSFSQKMENWSAALERLGYL